MSQDTAHGKPEFQLPHLPDGTSWTARENLHALLVDELLGPAEGERETLTVPPDTRYLLGRIAPTRLTADRGVEPETEADDDDSTLDLGDTLDAREGSGVPVLGVGDDSVSSDEDAPSEDEPIKRGLMITTLTVTASWGVYQPVRSERLSRKGDPLTDYQRTPHTHAVTFDPTALPAGRTSDFPLLDHVTLRVDTFLAGDRRLIEIALCNDRVTPRKIPTNAWLYQTELVVDSDAGQVFLPVRDPLLDDDGDTDTERRRLTLQYRDRLEFAIGRTCSVDWADHDPATRRTRQVRTTWLPVSDTPQTRAQEIPGALLDMTVLATADAAELEAGLRPIVDGYAAWLGLPDALPLPDGQQTQRQIAATLPDHLREDAEEAIDEAALVHRQLASGLTHLLGDDEALRCFRFMNAVMAEQRIRSQVSAARANDPSLSADDAHAAVLALGPQAHSWRTFQLAFVLLQLEALTDPTLARRSGGYARAELLFFPTGGGKTEAYLGLAAYTFAIRRRQGIVDTGDGPLDGMAGVAVLMRYTLRLLTAQQFQRATTLICAAEIARQRDPDTWGREPFRLGLWVGSNVTPKYVKDAAAQLRSANEGYGRVTALQIGRCPWCGTRIEYRNLHVDDTESRLRVYCGDPMAACPFSDGGAAGDGLPVLTVDEEIYRLAPAFVIGTVDKFARLAREGQAASLFGYVARRCDRHGYTHEDDRTCTIGDGKHPAKNGHPAATTHPVGRLRPPDLIIQDELHLITGALGTAVGLFEVAVDTMCTWRTTDGQAVRPLVVASSATVRNAVDQVRALYGRGVTFFPPQVLDVRDTYFSREVRISRENPGRRYIGVSTTGVRLTAAEIRISEVLLATGQLLLDECGAAADPYMTLVGYFNATRELAGLARYIKDDVRTALSKGRSWWPLPTRHGTAFGNLNIAELTARASGSDIKETLDEMALAFDWEIDSTPARDARRQAAAAAKATGRQLPRIGREVNPFDVVLATSMLQVGVDVSRLGLMLTVGQPKNTAEYIQATSRVGRDASRPGFVVALCNWARPRDLAHYEQFRHYHETFYAQVEPLSVTPFSVAAMERGLDGVLVAAARVLQASRPDGLSPERRAGYVDEEDDFLRALVEALTARARQASDEPSAAHAHQRLVNRHEQWVKRARAADSANVGLVYDRVTDASKYQALIRSAESITDSRDVATGPPFVVANSMREVQPEINILVSPLKERLFHPEPTDAPRWDMPTAKGDE
jgi:hypothetical protein